MTTTPTVPAAGSADLTRAARRLDDLAVQVRTEATTLTAAAAASGWRSTAATACRAALADLAGQARGAAALLDQASQALDDHARVAAHRAAVLEQATADLARLAVGGPVREVAGLVGALR